MTAKLQAELCIRFGLIGGSAIGVMIQPLTFAMKKGPNCTGPAR